jgi:hypothetical protein
MKIKEIKNYMENNVRKTKLVITDNGKDTAIILEGEGKLSVAVSV